MNKNKNKKNRNENKLKKVMKYIKLDHGPEAYRTLKGPDK